MTVISEWTSRQALLAGDLTERQIDSMRRKGVLARIRPGKYVDAEAWAGTQEQERHRIRALEVGNWLAGRAVVSHISAALLLGMQFAGGADSRIHVTWPGSPGRRGTTNIRPHRGRLSEEDVVVVKGVMTTTPARTAFDIARSTDWDHAVSVVDSALPLRLCTPADLVTVLARYARTPSASRVMRIFEFADGRAESVGESICRLRIAQPGLPAPELQTVLKLAPGSPEARVDFDFPGYRTVAEFDGKVKYGRLLKVEQAAGDVVFGEKVREDRIRDTGRGDGAADLVRPGTAGATAEPLRRRVPACRLSGPATRTASISRHRTSRMTC